MEFGRHLGKGIWGIADKVLPMLYGLGYVFLVIRVLPEEEFGTFVLLQEIFLIVSGLATALALQPLLKYAAQDESASASMIGAATVVSIVFLLVASGILLLAAHPISMMFNAPLLISLMPLIPIMLGASLLRNVALTILQARFMLREAFWVDAAHFLGAPFLVWIASRLHMFSTARDLAIISILSLSCSSLVGYALARRMLTGAARLALGDVRKIWEYGKFTLGGIVSYLAYSKADTFFISALAGPVAVAVYNAAKVFTRVYEVIPQVVQMFVMPATSRLSAHGEYQSLTSLVEKAIHFVTVAMVPVFILFLAGPTLLVDLLYGGRYAEAIPVLQVFAVLALVIPLMAVGSNVLLGIGEVRLNFHLSLVMLTVSTAGYIAFIPWLGVVGAALAYVVATVVVTWRTAVAMNRFVPLTVRAVMSRWHDITRFARRMWREQRASGPGE